MPELMINDDLLSFLENFCKAGSEAAMQKGYQWFHYTLINNLTTATRIYPSQKEILAESWLTTGEVYELLYAPLQAVDCYQTALKIYPGFVDAHHWQAIVQEQLGQYISAQQHINTAISLAPEEETLMWDRQRIQDCIVYDKAPEFLPNDLVWSNSELLARQALDQVIDDLSTLPTDNIELLQCLYRAYGAKRAIRKGKLVWEKMKRLATDWDLAEVDNFYWT